MCPWGRLVLPLPHTRLALAPHVPIKLPTGAAQVLRDLSPATTLGQVRNMLGSAAPRDHIFAQMPNLEFRDEAISLADARLCPRASIFLKPAGRVTVRQGAAGYFESRMAAAPTMMGGDDGPEGDAGNVHRLPPAAQGG
ncbi:hypothetical protein PAPYR_334 [Paratrimastix pyriformis]|uniref:Uncharacterized protein n=1 Tax=Paratrimastix pyriformis TaxID=342808 RepID=A0ABQ8UVE9_9EUKA|nr:hypothetical protein PAPYR_334 [Paratrimastix pyriformis]